jgi:predicted short-subunit dehydrogenase-like oxidoreductase (DUF2520 family)
MPVLNIIGCGRVGRTLAQLWRAQGVFDIGDVNDHREEKSRAAVAFIGGGRACVDVGTMRAAPLWLLATPDDRIEDTCRALSSGALAAGDIVFHCSGALPSAVLAAAAARGAMTASVHPLKTFAEPASAVQTFSGTSCAAEGDAAALAVLTPAFERIGAQVFALDPAAKTLYHAASVLVCNDLTALLEAGARVFAAAGIPRVDALRRIEPLVRETLDNAFSMGPAAALTGPVARGDVAVVQRQLAALSAVDGNLAEVYRSLAVIAVELATARGSASAVALSELGAVLKKTRR